MTLRERFREWLRAFLAEPAGPAEEPPEVWQEWLTDVAPTAVRGADFGVELCATYTGEWNPAAVRTALRDLVVQCTADRLVTEDAAVQDLLNSARSRQLPDSSTVITSIEAVVRVSASAVARTEEHQRLAAARAAREYERAEQVEDLRFLWTEIFSKPELARMYWHRRHPDRLQELGGEVFEVIAGRRTDACAPPDPLVDAVAEFLRGLDGPERAQLISTLPVIFQGYGREDLAAAVPTQHAPDDL
ncbi:hypothetical protein GCM10010124_21910 [Pilimelia terevasa]|uniref:Uncharacterized protein n=1 Tax=Pilimelia terevasa TaxID=53372 RepID=A0A8J3BPF6_9ACTN|nr:hypothetical protein [Pilimelia terevasa]GGK28808.1 hypothetical protein GCM10010124_21910 [Pilimelia terevasa]